MKVVFDTNVFVSALTLRGGRAEHALGRIVAGEDSIAISRPIIDEARRSAAYLQQGYRVPGPRGPSTQAIVEREPMRIDAVREMERSVRSFQKGDELAVVGRRDHDMR